MISCTQTSPSASVHFSPDGSTVAYTYVDRIGLPLPPEVPTLYSTAYLRWCSTHQTKSCRTIKIDSYGKSYGSFVQDDIKLLFSPDSRHIAVESPHSLEVVDLADEERHRLTDPDERVTSMGWLGSNEMVYVSHKESDTGKQGGHRIRQIFRHAVQEAPGKRMLLYEQLDYSGNDYDYVSPAGDYVVFMSQGYSNGTFSLLNVQTGTVKVISEKKARCQAVSWKPDGSGVFYLSSKEALLLYPREDRIKDLSGNYDNDFRVKPEFEPKIDPLWTPDGKFIVLNSSKTGGSVICPDPWRVILIGKLLVNYLEKKDNPHFCDPLDSYPWIFVQPYPGWVRIWICLVSDEKQTVHMDTAELERRNYLADYEGKQFFPMKSSFSPGGAWTITPDGKKMVYFDDMIRRPIFLEEETVHLPGNNH
jgi:dipeptidyl aminopeptidase/acylaminoacyl peptidase